MKKRNITILYVQSVMLHVTDNVHCRLWQKVAKGFKNVILPGMIKLNNLIINTVMCVKVKQAQNVTLACITIACL